MGNSISSSSSCSTTSSDESFRWADLEYAASVASSDKDSTMTSVGGGLARVTNRWSTYQRPLEQPSPAVLATSQSPTWTLPECVKFEHLRKDRRALLHRAQDLQEQGRLTQPEIYIVRQIICGESPCFNDPSDKERRNGRHCPGEKIFASFYDCISKPLEASILGQQPAVKYVCQAFDELQRRTGCYDMHALLEEMDSQYTEANLPWRVLQPLVATGELQYSVVIVVTAEEHPQVLTLSLIHI